MNAAAPPADCDVMIVGAGPTGLGAACELARHGLRVRIVDQDAGPTSESRALGVHARTMELFEKIGIADLALAAGLPLHAINVTERGQRLGRIKLPELATPYSFVLSLPQGETERLLAARLEELGVRVEWNTRLVRLEGHEHGVSGTLRTADDLESPFDVPWLCGCDGAHSEVRKQLKLPFEGSRFPEWFGLADARIRWERPHNEAHIFLSPGAPLAIFPLPTKDRYRLIAFLPDQDVDQEPVLDLARFQKIMNDRCGEPASLDDAGWIAPFRIHRRIVPQQRVGRVLLAGDAAHIHSPVGGQGMNTGIQDAVNLAWKLALVHRGAAGDALLDSYHDERHPIAAATLRGTDWATRLMAVQNHVVEQVRNSLIGLLANREFVRRRIAHAVMMIDVNYRHSPIVAQQRQSLAEVLLRRDRGEPGPMLAEWYEFFNGPQAGDRAPDAPIELPNHPEVSRLFKILERPRHVLLWWTGIDGCDGGDNTIRAAAEHVGQHFPHLLDGFVVSRDARREPFGRWAVLRDTSGAAHQAYGAEHEALYLIRPDGYVAWRSQPADAEALLAYLGQWFL